MKLRKRGVLTIPEETRRRMKLDEPGTVIELIEREDGVLELHPKVAIPADQAWFWSERWQRMEREVDEHVERGETTVHESDEDFFDHLDRLARKD